MGGKSIRSKVKKKFRSIKREALQPQELARNHKLADKDRAAVQKMSLNPDLANKAVLNTTMNMAVEQTTDYQFDTSRSNIAKRIRKKSRRPPNAKRENMKKKAASYFKKKKKK